MHSVVVVMVVSSIPTTITTTTTINTSLIIITKGNDYEFYDLLIKLIYNIHKDENVIICLSGRGDKDVHTVADYLGKKF